MTPAQREQLNRFLVVSVFALLLSVGVAQAGDLCVDDGLGGCKPLHMYVDKNLGLVIEPTEKPGCYQKMQEAMRNMGEYISDRRPEQFTFRCEAKGKMEVSSSLNPFEREALKRWDTVMQECVE